jgi:hypothetical protein
MMVGAACIGADMWALYLSSARLQQAADAAVLSAASYLPANPALAQNVARSKAQMKGISESEIVYNRPAADGRSITMVVERNVPYRFARLLGLSQSLVTVKAVASTDSSHSAAGLLPIGVQCDAHCAAYQSITLRLAPTRGQTPGGSWRPLAMGGCKGCDVRQNYQRNLFNGYESPVSVGDTVSVEAGDQAAVTQSALVARLYAGSHSDPGATPVNYATGDPRRIEVPIVDFNSTGGNSDGSTALVHGFAALWMTSVDARGNINAQVLDSFATDTLLREQTGRGALTSVLLH